jgi:penicillin-binding protein 2
MFAVLGLAIFNLQVLGGNRFRKLSDKNCIRLIPQGGARGKILDTEGRVIVDSKLTYDLLILPQGAKELDRALPQMARILGLGAKEVRDSLRRNYVSSSVPTTIVRNIETKKAIALEELKNDFPGIIIQPHPVRHYPYERLACHAIGYIHEIDHWRLTRLSDYGYKTKDLVGFGGVEEAYDYYLRQEEGGLAVEVDHRGNFRRVLGFKSPKNGKDIQLTFNLKIQQIVEDSFGDRAGCVVLIEPSNGEIIALASFPSFNPLLFLDNKNNSIEALFKDPSAPLLNRAISGLYPSGSVFKPIVAAAAMQTKKINLSTTFICTGSIMIGGKEFKCWSRHGQQDIIAAITNSCNIFFYRTGLLLGAQIIHDYALKFGLGNKTLCELPYEASGFLPSPLWKRLNRFQGWFDGDTANFSIGQGDLLVTPLQMVRMISVFANRGYLVRPYLVKSIDGKDISALQKKITPVPLRESTIANIRQALREVIASPQGTGNVLAGLSVAVAGKTGTAQVASGQPHSWFIGFFPVKNPKFAICVFLEHGGPGYYACLVARQIIEEMLKEGLVV